MSGQGRLRRLVVVGNGMAAQATVEAALAHRDPAEWEITMVGREPEAPYDRVRLSAMLAEPGEESVLALRPRRWYEDRGIALLTGTEIVRVDTHRRLACTGSDEALPYDALVLATGSRPLMPAIEGLSLPGVHAFRTLADARAILAASRGAKRALVVGGGLLGLEAARGLVAQGVEVAVVHLADRLMETQLDGLGAGMLEREMRRLGVEVLRDRRSTEVLGTDRAAGLRLAGGEEIHGDMVVVAAGIRPEIELAESMGLETGSAVLVDDEMRASAPAVWAVGECAQHRGRVYGLWAPILEQAKVAGASVAERPAAFHGAVPATTLKVMGVGLFCGGRQSADPEEDEVLAMDTRSGTYRKLVLRGDRLVGATLLGDLASSRDLAELLRSGDAVPEDLASPGETAVPEVPAHDEDLVCTCNEVTRGAILSVARDRGLERIGEVREATRAASGCGSCAPAVEALLAELRDERDESRREEWHADRAARRAPPARAP